TQLAHRLLDAGAVDRRAGADEPEGPIRQGPGEIGGGLGDGHAAHPPRAAPGLPPPDDTNDVVGTPVTPPRSTTRSTLEEASSFVNSCLFYRHRRSAKGRVC